MLVVSQCAHTDGLEVSQIEVTYIEVTSIKNGEELREYVLDQINIVKKVTIDEYIKEVNPKLRKFIAEHGMINAHIFFSADQNMSRSSIKLLAEYMHKKAEQRLKERIL